MSAKEESTDELIAVEELVLYKNTLVYQNTAYQWSHVASIWIADRSYKIKHPFPSWTIGVALLGGAAAAAAVFFHSWWLVALGVVFLVVAFFAYTSYEAESAVPNFAIGLELNSGRRKLFASPDPAFTQQAARVLLECMSGNELYDQKIIVDFETKVVRAEKTAHSGWTAIARSDSLVGNV